MTTTQEDKAAEQRLRASFETVISASPYEKSVRRFPDDPTNTCWPGSYVDISVDMAWCVVRALAAEREGERLDAARWHVVLACVRQGQFGEWVIHEDDPHHADGTKAMFVAAIDAALAKEHSK